jgi:Amt family ammonium transporter
MVESGQVRKKNASSIFVKNVYNVIVGVLVYWLIGFGFSYGEVRIFIGNSGDFFATNKLD